MMIRRFAAVAATTLLAAIAAGQPSLTAQQAGGPKLVVVLVADQMRSDYLDRLGLQGEGGLRRIMREGAMFAEAAYPYMNTVTCPGHATIGTGALPYRHGMILNEWYDRKAGALQPCTKDVTTTLVSYGGFTGTSESPRNLQVPTLGDRVRERANGRIVTMSLKPRSAIALAGNKGDSVIWFDDRGAWATSSAYANAPVPFVQKFVSANPVTADLGKVWERALEVSRYEHTDEGIGEKPLTGWTKQFPHPLAADGKAEAAFFTRWKASPYADEYLARMAADAVDALNLGRGEGVDFLGVAFSTLDSVGHAYGPVSHEVQDIVIRLNLTIGRLLDHLDKTVGRDNYVVGFSSDHGVAPIPEQISGAGRHTGTEIAKAINAALQPHLGAGEHVARTAYTDVYFAPGVANRLKRDGKAMSAALAAARALPGIVRAFTADELDDRSARLSNDPVRRAAALNHFPGRSGDLIVVPRENWILSTSATTHGTHYTYDTRVPVMFFGAGVQPGRFTSPATPADVAPTLAALARVPFDVTDGRVLMPALARPTTARR